MQGDSLSPSPPVTAAAVAAAAAVAVLLRPKKMKGAKLRRGTLKADWAKYKVSAAVKAQLLWSLLNIKKSWVRTLLGPSFFLLFPSFIYRLLFIRSLSVASLVFLLVIRKARKWAPGGKADSMCHDWVKKQQQQFRHQYSWIILFCLT